MIFNVHVTITIQVAQDGSRREGESASSSIRPITAFLNGKDRYRIRVGRGYLIPSISPCTSDTHEGLEFDTFCSTSELYLAASEIDFWHGTLHDFAFINRTDGMRITPGDRVIISTISRSWHTERKERITGVERCTLCCRHLFSQTIDISQAAAVIEGRFAYRGHTTADNHSLERRTPVKGRSADGSDSIADGDVCQGRTHIKRILWDSLQAITNGNRLQRVIIGKGPVTHGGDCIPD